MVYVITDESAGNEESKGGRDDVADFSRRRSLLSLCFMELL